MNNNKVSHWQVAAILMIIIHGSFFGGVSKSFLNLTGQDMMLVLLVTALITAVNTFLILMIFNYRKTDNLFEKGQRLLGKKLSVVLNLLVVAAFALLLIQVLGNIVDFVLVIHLPRTPIILPGIALIIIIAYGVSSGLESVLRLAPTILVISLFSFLFLGLCSSQINTENFLPALTLPASTVTKASLFLGTIINVPLLFLLFIPRDHIADQHVKKAIISGVSGGLILILLDLVFTIGMLGIELALLYRHPEYHVLTKVNLFSFFKNVEKVLSIRWILEATMVMMVALKMMKRGLLYSLPDRLKGDRRVIAHRLTIVLSFLLIFIVATPNISIQNYYHYSLVLGLLYLSIILLLLIPLIINGRRRKRISSGDNA